MTELDLDRLEAVADATNRDLPWWGPNTLMNGRPRLTEADAVFIAETGPDVVKELIRQLREARAGLADAWAEGREDGQIGCDEPDGCSLCTMNPYRSGDE